MRAAIDIGSNAIRLAIAPSNDLTNIKSYRAPVRLGQDVFNQGRISEETLTLLVRALNIFKNKMKSSKVDSYKIVATSAVREAKNKNEIIQSVLEQTGMQISLIDGLEEAELIHTAIEQKVNLRGRPTLMMDIGGGSVELVFSQKNQIVDAFSKKIGTVRLISKVDREDESCMEQWVHIIEQELKVLENYDGFFSLDPEQNVFVGTGGNLRAIGKLCKSLELSRRSDKIKKKHLDRLITLLTGYNYQERIDLLGLRPDRADVIMPACLVTQYLMDYFNFKDVRLPDVGLKDGVLLQLNQELALSKNA